MLCFVTPPLIPLASMGCPWFCGISARSAKKTSRVNSPTYDPWYKPSVVQPILGASLHIFATLTGSHGHGQPWCLLKATHLEGRIQNLQIDRPSPWKTRRLSGGSSRKAQRLANDCENIMGKWWEIPHNCGKRLRNPTITEKWCDILVRLWEVMDHYRRILSFYYWITG